MRSPKECGRWSVAVLACVAIAANATDDCEHSADRTAELPLDGVSRVFIDASIGSLLVLGSAEQKTASAHGIACASSKEVLDKIKLIARKSGQSVYLTAELPVDMWSPMDWLDNERAMALDLTVRVPSTMTVDVKDSSGSIEIRGTGKTRIEDGSGSILVEDIHGDLEIDDGSGSVLVDGARGDVHVEDGSGSIHIQQVSGRVSVQDGSGSIAISDVTKDVVVQRDGSGSISVTNVGGSFTVERDGSGGVSHRGVKGRISIDD